MGTPEPGERTTYRAHTRYWDQGHFAELQALEC